MTAPKNFTWLEVYQAVLRRHWSAVSMAGLQELAWELAKESTLSRLHQYRNRDLTGSLTDTQLQLLWLMSNVHLDVRHRVRQTIPSIRAAYMEVQKWADGSRGTHLFNADKNMGLCVAPIAWHKRTLDTILSNRRNYKVTGKSALSTAWRHASMVRCIPKVHKNVPDPTLTPGRPIVQGFSSLEASAKYISTFGYKWLAALDRSKVPAGCAFEDLRAQHEHVGLAKAKAYVNGHPHCHIAEFDVKDCYPSISPSAVKECIEWLLQFTPPSWLETANNIKARAGYLLANTFVQHNRNVLQQIAGLSQGSPAAPFLCDMTLYRNDLEFRMSHRDVWHMRFLDDILLMAPWDQQIEVCAGHLQTIYQPQILERKHDGDGGPTEWSAWLGFQINNLGESKIHFKPTWACLFSPLYDSIPMKYHIGYLHMYIARFCAMCSSFTLFQETWGRVRMELPTRGYPVELVDLVLTEFWAAFGFDPDSIDPATGLRCSVGYERVSKYFWDWLTLPKEVRLLTKQRDSPFRKLWGSAMGEEVSHAFETFVTHCSEHGVRLPSPTGFAFAAIEEVFAKLGGDPVRLAALTTAMNTRTMTDPAVSSTPFLADITGGSSTKRLLPTKIPVTQYRPNYPADTSEEPTLSMLGAGVSSLAADLHNSQLLPKYRRNWVVDASNVPDGVARPEELPLLAIPERLCIPKPPVMPQLPHRRAVFGTTAGATPEASNLFIPLGLSPRSSVSSGGLSSVSSTTYSAHTTSSSSPDSGSSSSSPGDSDHHNISPEVPLTKSNIALSLMQPGRVAIVAPPRDDYTPSPTDSVRSRSPLIVDPISVDFRRELAASTPPHEWFSSPDDGSPISSVSSGRATPNQDFHGPAPLKPEWRHSGEFRWITGRPETLQRSTPKVNPSARNYDNVDFRKWITAGPQLSTGALPAPVTSTAILPGVDTPTAAPQTAATPHPLPSVHPTVPKTDVFPIFRKAPSAIAREQTEIVKKTKLDIEHDSSEAKRKEPDSDAVYSESIDLSITVVGETINVCTCIFGAPACAHCLATLRHLRVPRKK